MESNYRLAYKSEWNKLKSFDLLDVSKRLKVSCTSDRNKIIVPFFEKDYILDVKTESIYRKDDNKMASISDSIIILNYLTHSTDYITTTNKWVSLKEITNGGVLFYPAFHKMTILELVKKYGKDINEFEKSATGLAGREIRLADKGYEFKVLPKVNVRIGIWEGDDEISCSAQILFQDFIQYILHIETIIGIGASVVEKVIDYKSNNYL